MEGCRLVPIWYQSHSGSSLVPFWYHSGTNLVPIWYQSGTSLVPGWYQTTGFPYIFPLCPRYQSSVVCQNPESKCPTQGLKIILRESEGTRKFSKFGASCTRLVPEWHQTRGSTSLSPRCPWWQKPGHGHPWLRTHGWLAIAAQPRPASDAPRRPAPFPLSIVSRFFPRVGPRRGGTGVCRPARTPKAPLGCGRSNRSSAQRTLASCQPPPACPG